MKQNKKANTKKTVSLFRMLKAIWGVKLPWLPLILYVVATVGTMLGSLIMAGATGDMVDAGGNIASATLISFAAGYIVIGAGSTLSTIFSGLAGERINVSLRERMWRKLMYIPQKYYDTDGGETLVSRITTDCDYASSLLITLIGLVTSVFTLFGYITSMLATNVQLTLAIFTVIPVSIIIGILYGKAKYALGKKTQGALSDATYYLIERTKNLPLIKVANMSEVENQRGKEVFDEQCKLEIRAGYLSVINLAINTGSNMVGILLVFILGASLVNQGLMTTGDVIAFYSISSSVTLAFANLIGDCGTIRHAVGSMSRVAEVMESESEDTAKGRDMDVANEDIRFENVTFGYTPETPVLEELSCVIPKNKVTAIIGANGSGKTTLFKLLERMYQPGEGMLYFGNADASEFSLHAWRKAFGLVSQDRPVLEGTLRENMTYGCEREIFEDELWEVARMANLEALVKELPEGFDTMVAPGGRNFSGGQCQCIAIARAMMHNPDYLLLDEATSNLDVKSEKAVTAAIRTLMEGRTTIIIAHNLSAIRHADNVLVLKDGKIAAAGSPADILKTSAEYREFVTSQSAVL